MLPSFGVAMISAWQMEAVQQKQHHDSFGANRAGVYLHGGTVVPASGVQLGYPFASVFPLAFPERVPQMASSKSRTCR